MLIVDYICGIFIKLYKMKTISTVFLITLSACSMPRNISKSATSAVDSTAKSSSNTIAQRVVTTQMEGRKTIVEYKFGHLDPAMLERGITEPPIESITATTVEQLVHQVDTSACESASVVENRVQSNLQTLETEDVAPDPYRWRWIFGIAAIALIGLVLWRLKLL